jgi:hypothetical protein
MKKRTLLYIPALILFVFAISVLVAHFSRMPERNRDMTKDVAMAFSYSKRVVSVSPEAENAGLKLNDIIVTMNGRNFDGDNIWHEELAKGKETGQINLTVQRKTEDKQTETKELTVPVIKVEKDFSFYATWVLRFIFIYLMPVFCIFVGFWVVFVRIHDFLAWLLLFLMLGFSCIGLEGSTNV